MWRPAAFALSALIAMPALAQPSGVSELLDQSLLQSEPVEDSSAAPSAPPAAETAAPDKPAEEAPVYYDTALLQGLKKVTAETSVVEAPVDQPIAFGTLTITVKKCVKSRPEDEPENTALILITDQKPDGSEETVFSGWMFSSSPALSALEHPVYDITMLECVAKKDASGDRLPPPQ